jgi:hypothetical protein
VCVQLLRKVFWEPELIKKWWNYMGDKPLIRQYLSKGKDWNRYSIW